MQRFVHNQNLLRFVDLLERETDPVKRGRLQDLLLEEENRFGSRREQALELDSMIAGARLRIARQRQVVNQMEAEARGADLAGQILASMEQTYALLLESRGRFGTNGSSEDPLEA